MRSVGRIHIAAIIQKDDGTITGKDFSVDYSRAESMFISRLFLFKVNKYCDKSKSPQCVFKDDMGEYAMFYLPHEATEESIIHYFVGLCGNHLRTFEHHKAISKIKEFFKTTMTECNKEYAIAIPIKDNNKTNMLKIYWLLLKYAYSNFQQRDAILNQIAYECWGAKDGDITEDELKFAKEMFPNKTIDIKLADNVRYDAGLLVNASTVQEVIETLSRV